MTLIIDASVLVAAAQHDEPGSGASRAFLSAALIGRTPLVLPWLAWVETVSAIARKSATAGLAVEAGQRLRDLPVHWVELDERMAQEAAATTVACRLRAADAVYVALAVRLEATLVTLDREIETRCEKLCRCRTPEAWLAELGRRSGIQPSR